MFLALLFIVCSGMTILPRCGTVLNTVHSILYVATVENFNETLISRRTYLARKMAKMV